MKKQFIGILVLAAIAASLAFTIPQNEAVCADHGAAASGMPVPPASPIPRPADAKVYIVSPKDGDTVEGPVTVIFGLKGMGVAPAGIYMGPESPTGHHHIVLNAELPNLKLPFPMDEKHLHFGKGQTEATLELEPGENTIQLVLGDHIHMPHDPPLVSEKITITVK